ncbi:hypothetical protein Dimus_015260 [Dionaea muscipula]
MAGVPPRQLCPTLFGKEDGRRYGKEEVMPGHGYARLWVVAGARGGGEFGAGLMFVGIGDCGLFPTCMVLGEGLVCMGEARSTWPTVEGTEIRRSAMGPLAIGGLCLVCLYGRQAVVEGSGSGSREMVSLAVFL